MDFYKKKLQNKEPREALYEIECKYVSLQAIVNSCLRESNDKTIKNLLDEINSHLIDLQALKQNNNDVKLNTKCDELIKEFQECLIKIINQNASENTLTALIKQQKYFENLADEAIKEKEMYQLRKLLERIEGNICIFNELPEVKNSKNVEKFKRFMEVKLNYEKLTARIRNSIATEKRIISAPIMHLDNNGPSAQSVPSKPSSSSFTSPSPHKQNSPKSIKAVRSLLNSCVPLKKSTDLPPYKSQFEKELNTVELRHVGGDGHRDVSSENGEGIFGTCGKLTNSFDQGTSNNKLPSKILRYSNEELGSLPIIKRNVKWCEIDNEFIEKEKPNQQTSSDDKQSTDSHSIDWGPLILPYKTVIPISNFRRSSGNVENIPIILNNSCSTPDVENPGENIPATSTFNRSSLESELVIMPKEKLTTTIYINNNSNNSNNTINSIGLFQKKCILSTFKSNSIESNPVNENGEDKVLRQISDNINSLNKLITNLSEIKQNNVKEKIMKMKQIRIQLCNIPKRFDEIFPENSSASNENSSFEKYWEEINGIKNEIESFKGLMRDEEYLNIDRKLTKLFAEINEIPMNCYSKNMERHKLLQYLNDMNDVLKNRVLKNEEIMNYIFDEIVTFIGFRHPVVGV